MTSENPARDKFATSPLDLTFNSSTDTEQAESLNSSVWGSLIRARVKASTSESSSTPFERTDYVASPRDIQPSSQAPTPDATPVPPQVIPTPPLDRPVAPQPQPNTDRPWRSDVYNKGVNPSTITGRPADQNQAPGYVPPYAQPNTPAGQETNPSSTNPNRNGNLTPGQQYSGETQTQSQPRSLPTDIGSEPKVDPALIQRSLKPRYGYSGILGALNYQASGLVGGALGDPILPALLPAANHLGYGTADFILSRQRAPQFLTDSANWYQSRFTRPSGLFNNSAFQTLDQSFKRDLVDQSFAQWQSWESQRAAALANGTPLTPAAQAEAATATLRYNILGTNDPKEYARIWNDAQQAENRILQAKNLNASSASMGTAEPFTAAEIKAMEDRLDALRARPDLKSYGGRLFSGIQDGLSYTFVNAIAPHNDAPGSLVSSIAVPAALIYAPDKAKLPLAVAAALGGHALDAGWYGLTNSKPPTGQGQWLNTNGIEGLTMSTALALPITDPRERATVVGLTWLGNRMINMDNTQATVTAGVVTAGGLFAPGLDFRTRALIVGADWATFTATRLLRPNDHDLTGVNAEAMKALENDKNDRSESSLFNAVDKLKELGKGKQEALNFYYEDYKKPGRQFDNLLSAFRGCAAVSVAYGETRLASGTLIPHAEHPTFQLEGLDLDLNGKALRALLFAKENLNKAKEQTTQLAGQKVSGSTVQQSEVEALDKMSQRVDADVQKIYGQHKIASAVDSLAQYSTQDYRGFSKLLVDLSTGIAANRNITDKAFLAKLCRDYAVMSLAVAKGNPSHGSTALYGAEGTQGRILINPADGTPTGFDGAFQMAKQLDPTSPDLAELESIANELKQQVPATEQSQLTNPLTNPLGVNPVR